MNTDIFPFLVRSFLVFLNNTWATLPPLLPDLFVIYLINTIKDNISTNVLCAFKLSNCCFILFTDTAVDAAQLLAAVDGKLLLLVHVSKSISAAIWESVSCRQTSQKLANFVHDRNRILLPWDAECFPNLANSLQFQWISLFFRKISLLRIMITCHIQIVTRFLENTVTRFNFFVENSILWSLKD